ncbi:MAG: hypothetical protein K8S25_15725 [Alphaproteobacteria bacterium]|nr:hypothetical protein [Alphaproteobacteria bacterium]
MRDLLAVAGVIVLALCLGGTAAYMSVDLTPPGLELIRPPKPAVVAKMKRDAEIRTVQAEAGGCKYCAGVADLAKTFTRRADSARRHALALREAMPQISDETSQAAGRELELKTADASATEAEAAAAVLTGWASRCMADDICKIPARSSAAACATQGDPRSASALLIALSVRNAAQACASASCPSVDCQATAGLQSDLGQIDHALDEVGGRVSAVAGKTNAALLPVGASTLKGELKRVADEAGYVTKMLPLLLDDSKPKSASEKMLPKLAPEMVDERAVSTAQLAVVMEQAAAVSDTPESDPRREAAWRLKSLAANMAALGRDAHGLSSSRSTTGWEQVSDSLGGALMDLARLQAMLDRVSKPATAAADCDGSAAAAAQQLREASAMLDLCRLRSACVGRNGAPRVMKAATGDLNATFERAQHTADALIVNEIGEQTVVQVADGATEPKAIDVLRSRGVCRRAGEMREASAAAPVVAQAVAEAATAPALMPTVGILAPQDVVAGAVDVALNEPAPVESVAPAETIVDVAARYSNSMPRRKPRLPSHDPALMQAAAPTPANDAAYQGVVLPQAGGPQPGLAFGGEGGPQQFKAPPSDPAPAQH